MKSVLMIIPARKGSKRLPNKNMRPMAGKPMLQWTLEAAADAAFELCKKEMLVSILLTTDYSSEDIDAVSDSTVHYHERHPQLCGPFVTMEDVVRDAIYYSYGSIYGVRAETIILLQPTSPTRTAQDIIDALKQYEENNLSKAYTGTGYKPDGSIYIFDEGLFLNDANADCDFFSGGAHVGPYVSSVDVDTEEDFAKAETILLERQRACA